MQDFPLRLTKSFVLSHLGDHRESRPARDFLLVREPSQNLRSKIRSKSSKRGKRIRLFGNIAKSDVRAVAIECWRKIAWQYEGKQCNCHSTRALVLVLRRARFRGV
jgi:hypothetical protein